MRLPGNTGSDFGLPFDPFTVKLFDKAPKPLQKLTDPLGLREKLKPQEPELPKLPDIPSRDDPEVEAKRRAAEQAAKKRRGRGSTRLSGLLVDSDALVTRPELRSRLGE